MRVNRSVVPGLVLGILAGFQAPAAATLYSAAGGYQHTGGSQHYWAEEFWGYGSMRLEGGWYPYGRLSLVSDSFYKWVAAPTAGIEKGFPGWGKGRVGYTYYRGDLRFAPLSGDSHAVEIGGSKAFTPALTGDLAYQWISGDLFAGANRELESAGGRVTPRHSVVQQVQTALGYDWTAWKRKMHLEGVVSGARSSDSRRFLAETLGVAVPLVNDVALQAEGTLVQDSGGRGRYYVGAGLSYSLSGRWKARDEF
jgi:hypothetical protein